MRPDSASLDRHADFHELSPATHLLPAAPRFQFGAMPAELAALFYGRTRLPATGVFTARGMEVSAGLLLRAEGKLIEAPALNWQASHIQHALARHGLPGPDQPARRVPGQCALIVTPGYPIFGHWLADMLPRLGLLEAAGHDLDALTYIVTPDAPAFGLELLRLVGIGPERLIQLDEHEPIRPDALLLPTFPHNGRQFTALMNHAASVLRSRVQARFGPLDTGVYPPSVLLTRHGWGARRMENRNEYETMAASHGFQIIAPETLPMIEQFRLLAGAREIIGEYGSALHSTLFAGPGSVVCALRGNQPHPAFIQSGIGDALDQPTGYVFGQGSGDPERRGFAVQTDDLRACLETVFGQHRPRLQGGASLPLTQSPPPSLPLRTDRPPFTQAAPIPAAHPTAQSRSDIAELQDAIEASLARDAHEEAFRLGCELLALSPRHPGLATTLASLAAALGNPREAIRFAITAVEHAPHDQPARAILATLLPPIHPGSAVPEQASPLDISFAANGNAASLMLAGWSRPEPRLTWMVDAVSELKLPLLSAQSDWLGVLDATPIVPAAALCLRFNGHELARLAAARTARPGFRIPREVIANGNPGVLTFEHPDCISPRELGRNRDPRRLAFAARSLRLAPAPPDTAAP